MSVPNNPHRTLATLAPKVTGEFLQRLPTGFAAFICDDPCVAFVERIIGTDNDVARLFSELRGDQTRHATRQSFKKWVGDVWLPRTVNPIKRGKAHWQRIGSILWSIYEDTVALRYRTKRAIQKDVERLARADKRKRKKMLAARARRKERRNHEDTLREAAKTKRGRAV